MPGHVAAVEWRRKRAKAYARRELAPILTCAWALNPGEPDGGVVRMEWDYQIEWSRGGSPRVLLLEYRAYRRADQGDTGPPGPDGTSQRAEFVLAERTATDIPVSEGVLCALAHHAAGTIYADSELCGSWCEAENYFLRGAVMAVRKGGDLADYRRGAQLRFRMRRFAENLQAPSGAAPSAEILQEDRSSLGGDSLDVRTRWTNQARHAPYTGQ